MSNGDMVARKGFDYPGVTIVFFCHDGEGSFVMAKRGAQARDEHGRWDIGAGGLEFDATVEETLRNEIREEYGTDVLTFECVGHRDVHRTYNGQPTHWISLDFVVRVDRRMVRNGEPHKFDAVDWFTLDALPPIAELHSQVPHFFEKYRGALHRALARTAHPPRVSAPIRAPAAHAVTRT